MWDFKRNLGLSVIISSTCLLMSCSSVLFQRRTIVKDITLIVPKGMYKVDTLTDLPSKMDSCLIVRKLNAQRVFRSENILILLNTGKGEFPADRLERSEKAWVEMLQDASLKYYNSNIKSYNNYKVLIQNYQFSHKDIGCYLLSGLNKKNNKVLSGIVEYMEVDHAKAEKVVDSLLKGIRFN